MLHSQLVARARMLADRTSLQRTPCWTRPGRPPMRNALTSWPTTRTCSPTIGEDELTRRKIPKKPPRA
ncbi:MAG: hypothetical protein U1F87_14970 [Kiritimatiellia bacterium]